MILIVNRLMFEIQINHIALNQPDKYNEYETFSELKNKGFYTWDPDRENHKDQKSNPAIIISSQSRIHFAIIT